GGGATPARGAAHPAAAGRSARPGQFGHDGLDAAAGVAVDARGVYVVGVTEGPLPGQTSAGGLDAFVRKYGANGTELWTRQFGSSYTDNAYGVAVDASGVYVAGDTTGDLPGHSLVGSRDAFVRKYDCHGSERWRYEFGNHFFGIASAFGIAADASGVYVVGLIGRSDIDAFVRKYDTAGHEQWTDEFGAGITDQDIAYGVAVDASGVYVAGKTEGTFPGQGRAGGVDAVVRECDAAG